MTADSPEPTPAAPDDTRPTPERRSRRRVAAYAGSGTLAVVGAVYVAAYVLAGDKVPDGTTVAGVAIGAMSPASAQETLESRLSERAGRPVALTGADERITVTPATAGISLDADATVSAAGGGRSWSPASIVRSFAGGGPVDPVLAVDEDALDTAVDAVAERVDVSPVEPRITFPDAEPTLREPSSGRALDRSRTAAVLHERALGADERSVPAPIAEREPTVSLAAARRSLSSYARAAVSGPVTLRIGDRDPQTLAVAAFAPALSVTGRNGEMEPSLDPEAIAKPLDRVARRIGTTGRDASYVIRAGKPVVVPSRPGIGIEPATVAEGLPDVLGRTGDERVLELEAGEVEADFTTKDAEGLGITERISRFATEFPYAEYRNVNQGRAAQVIDGTVIEPGETFSFNDTVGERTVENGFVTGTIIGGGRFQEDLGGGVSQVVTTAYNAGFFAGLEDVTHKPHSFYIDRYPEGREATVAWPTVDLKIRNDSDHGVLIKANVRKSTPARSGRTTVSMWSTKDYDVTAGKSGRRNIRYGTTRYDPSPECVSQGGVPGFDVTVFRYFARDGERVKTEKQVARYNAADQVICSEEP